MVNINNKCIIFTYKGRFAHFLKAEANTSAPTYPIPPRTVLIGLVGAILGMEKDQPQIELNNAKFAVNGNSESTHWHSANFRKIPPALLPYKIKSSDKGSCGAQKNTIISQEWLFKPSFTVWTILPDKYHSSFEDRIKNRRWYFTPCLGLSEMIADIEYIDSIKLTQLQTGEYEIISAIRASKAEINLEKTINRDIAIKSIRMPRKLTATRIFTHELYYIEMNLNPVPLKTSNAWNAGNNNIMWL